MRNIIYAIIVLAMCSLAKADVFTFTINSATYNDGVHHVGGYHSTVAHDEPAFAYPVISYCVDLQHTVGFNQSFQVSLVNLASYSGALQQNYWEAAYLVLQLQNVTDIGTISDIQRGIWLITSPGTSDPYLTTIGAFTWATQAAQNYQSVDPSQFVLAIPTGSMGQAQLFMVPEPATWAIVVFIGASLLLFVHLGRLKRKSK